ncbi:MULTISPECIES: 5-dehydro-4-deoxy-D-glucuronate isomerase [unclassified Pseudoclavibacter]|uniref:5-dehydro-4-deoxy-D-glucuronate isomerase n=1 Tax=unclassified Pseudoclavibacter TaxID=2615177 RepID=UPI0012F105D8|nr:MULTISPECIES: 5-dehydro-4-deoxy-D-glucuronate isomerase [unclassified Pseudoclavibacter]MBF4457649.1 5-dehydro-4-deoxy-D-glucuronate isomerase [Pseudoclavibacter sp. VKM Ac-2867]VXB04229.1 4-deoxy-L-threo-5-hexosulose-uronate ketol-isomerase [Pseudoclavibacter sp. 8L]
MTITKYAHSPNAVAAMKTDELRSSFLMEELFAAGEARSVYLHHDRILAFGVVPLDEPLELPTPDQVRAEFVLQRREAGVINVGGPGTVQVGGEEHELAHVGTMYLGRGEREVRFSSADPANPAAFYVFTATSHQDLPTTKITPDMTNVVELGDPENANRRTLNQCIYEGGTRSSQIAFGFTQVHSGSAWNTLPAHTHDRRTECYLYFDLAPEHRVFHVMGEPQETRHLVVSNRQLVVSPSWSVHFGAGTGPYTFVWATAGENTTYNDMDPVDTTLVR